MSWKDLEFKPIYTITVISLFLVIAHFVVKLIYKVDLVDSSVLGLLLLALAPWIIKIISRAELPGGLILEFQQIREEQKKQKADIEGITEFLIKNFVTENELKHLKNLNSTDSFLVQKDGNSHFLGLELRRLRDLKLIDGHPGKGIRTLENDPHNPKNVKDHCFITEKGKNYLGFLNNSH